MSEPAGLQKQKDQTPIMKAIDWGNTDIREQTMACQIFLVLPNHLTNN